MPAIYNCINQGVIQIIKGCDYHDTILLTNQDGTPTDLTGQTATSQLRTYAGALAGSFTCEIPEPLTGQIERHMHAAITATLSASTSMAPHVHGTRLTGLDGSVQPELQGGALVVPGVVQ